MSQSAIKKPQGTKTQTSAQEDGLIYCMKFFQAFFFKKKPFLNDQFVKIIIKCIEQHGKLQINLSLKSCS